MVKAMERNSIWTFLPLEKLEVVEGWLHRMEQQLGAEGRRAMGPGERPGRHSPGLSFCWDRQK
jgi:hypothetical protein